MLKEECVIPSEADLERVGYDKSEVEQLVNIGKRLNSISNVVLRGDMGRQFLRAMWGDELEYIAKTHWIGTTTPGVKVLFQANYAQLRFYKDVIQTSRDAKLPIRGIILKARQLGFSTFMQSWQYEQCEREDLRHSMTVSFDEPSTKELFAKAHMS